jgi:hypothetical protein
MAIKKIFIGPGKDDDYHSLAEWEADFKQVGRMKNRFKTWDIGTDEFVADGKSVKSNVTCIGIHCRSCNKKVAELREGNLIEIGCLRCKKKTVFGVQNLKRKD